MANRRTIGGVILNESVSSPSVGSPLRRKSLALPQVTPSIDKEIFQNDDEGEILARRKLPKPLDSSKATDTSERRVSLGLVPGLSANELREHYNKCIKLCTENKINPKNVFALSMIDYMSVLTRQDKNSDNMQNAGTTLDVGAKIYSVRVDCVHTDIVKMISEPGREEKEKENDMETEANNNTNTTITKETEAKQKKKRNKLQKIIGSEENVAGTFEAITLCSETNYSDSQTTDMLLQVTFPIHVNSGHNLHLWEDVLFDLPSDKERNGELINLEVEIIPVEELEELDICPSFKNFSLTNWSEDDIPNLPSPPSSPRNGSLQFDVDASLADNYNDYNNDVNYFKSDDEADENVDRCIRKGQEPENIVDFRESVADKTKDKAMDYSYMQKSLTNFHWAGPIHWKPKLAPKVLIGSRVVGACRQEAVRKKKEPIFEYTDEFLEDFTFKLRSKMPKKLQNKTLRQTWNEFKITLPEDIHYANSNPEKFYIHSTAMKPLRFKKPKEKEVGEEGVQVQEDVNYDYNNLNDTQDYCSQNNVPNDEINGDDDGENGFDNYDDINDEHDREENVNPFGDVYSQGFIGENLVTAPRSTQQIQIQYSTRAKKIDMRQLKRCIWKVLITDNGINEIIEEDKNNGERNTKNSLAGEINESRYFSSVYKQLPNMLGKNNADALSPALAFASLLHLANEKSLNIISSTDLSELRISNGDSRN